MSPIQRRRFLSNCLGTGVGMALMNPLMAASREQKLEQAAEILSQAVSSGQVNGAALHFKDAATSITRVFGEAKSADAAFLLGSISKPIAMTALMILYDKGRFQLDDPVKRFLPEFSGNGRDKVTIKHLLTHVSGLPDQLPDNASLRAAHAPLSEFVQGAVRLPLSFEPGTQYEYSSMGILLAAEIAQ
ncbi:MAG: serine hydrolase domain-containing protein, partial [Planctomycetaceae bacterium]